MKEATTGIDSDSITKSELKFKFGYNPALIKISNNKDPKKTILRHKLEASNQMSRQTLGLPLETPVCVSMIFVTKMPNYWSKKKKEKRNGEPVISKPSSLNLIKWILDILEGIVYADDCWVSSVTCSKFWGYEGEVDIHVYEKEFIYNFDKEINRGLRCIKETLKEIDEWADNLKKTYPQNALVISCSNFVKSKCEEMLNEELLES